METNKCYYTLHAKRWAWHTSLEQSVKQYSKYEIERKIVCEESTVSVAHISVIPIKDVIVCVYVKPGFA